MDCHATARGSNRCIYRASRPSQGTVNGVPSLNDLAVDGTLNTKNKKNIRQRVCPFNNIVFKKPFPATINHSTHGKQDKKNLQQL